MQVIPVLDLMGGHVVLAQGGLRDRYRPIETPLAPSSRAEEVLDGLLRVHPFDTVYLADLDAIQGTGSHDSLLADLARDRPGLRFWVDAGWTAADPVRDWLARHPGTAVLGSESLTDAADISRLDQRRIVLSLDFRGTGFQGPPELLEDAASWPGRVILMTLAQVGSDAGPDLARLAAMRARRPDIGFFAAGGVRGPADLDALKQAGAAGVLVATALHRGRLNAADIARVS